MRVLLQVVPALVARMRCCAGRPRLTSREDANAVVNEGILQSDALKNEAGAMRQQSKAARPGLLGYLGAGTSVASTFLGAKYGKKT